MKSPQTLSGDESHDDVRTFDSIRTTPTSGISSGAGGSNDDLSWMTPGRDAAMRAVLAHYEMRNQTVARTANFNPALF